MTLKMTTIRLPQEVATALQQIAPVVPGKKAGARSEYIRQALIEKLERDGVKLEAVKNER